MEESKGLVASLASVKSVDEATTFGIQLLREGNLERLLNAFSEQGVLFAEEDYWSDDKLHSALPESLLSESSQEENISTRILHILQVIQDCCPAVSHLIASVLRKATY